MGLPACAAKGSRSDASVSGSQDPQDIDSAASKDIGATLRLNSTPEKGPKTFPESFWSTPRVPASSNCAGSK